MKTSGIKFIFLFSLLSCIGAISLASDSIIRFKNSTDSIINGVEESNEKNETIYSLIQNEIPCPEFLKEEFADVRVKIVLRTTAEGEVLVENVITDDNRLVNYIKERLHRKVLKLKSADLQKEFSFSVRFRVI